MLCKTAPYLAALSIIPLLFITSEAELDIEQGKEAVSRLIIKLTSIALEDHAHNLDDLIEIANNIVTDNYWSYYLIEAAKGAQCWFNVLEHIDRYEKRFQTLLRNVGYNSDPDFFQMTPMFRKITQLRVICAQKHGRTSTTLGELLEIDINAEPAEIRRLAQGSPSLKTALRIDDPQIERGESSISRRRLTRSSSSLRELLRRDSTKTDANGFAILRGIQEVVVLLDELLKLVINKQCTNVRTFQEFGQCILQHDSTVYELLWNNLPLHADAIKKHIEEYLDDYWEILDVRYRSGDYVPMHGALVALKNQCEESLDPR